VAPGWHRLLYLKAFTLTACSANKAQTCNSQINRASGGVNFDLDATVARTFRQEQEAKYRNALADKLRKDARAKARREYTPFSSFGRRLWQLHAKRAAPEVDVHFDPDSVVDLGPDLDPPFQRKNESRRELYVNADGVFDLDSMIDYTQASDDWLKVTDRYWGMKRADVALRLDLLRQRLKPAYITSVINGGSAYAEPVPAGYRTGLESLMAARCSDFVKGVFPEDPRVRCCRFGPEGQSCQPENTYQSRPECNQGPLELADTNEETLAEEFLARLAGLSPPPSPPPSPRPPPPPSPPAPPPPPAPPVAITADAGKEMALVAQRQFCDSAITTATPNPTPNPRAPLARTRAPRAPRPPRPPRPLRRRSTS